jgi:prepilin-type N-terminal cleavage/methylation domain-containing protein
VEGASAPTDRGFTLIELVIAVGVIAVTAAAGIGISLATRSLAVTSAATEFDQFLDSARTMARDLDGTTLAFESDAYGDGTQVRLLARDANGALIPTTLPPLHARAIIEETLSLGKPPFAFVVHVNGALGGRPGFHVGDDSSAEVGCPPSGAFHFLIHTANASAERFVPCRVALANTGPVSLSSLPPEPTAPPPTPCAGVGCTTPSLPPPPASTPSCPSGFTPVQGGCVPTPTPTPNAGAHYHVTIAGAAPTLSAGTTEAFTAQATLTNAASVAPGTPASIPVFVAATTPGICTATPPGSQPSGTSFTITALLAGTCTIAMQGDTSGVIGSSADTASITVTISNVPAPTPTPQSCDLMQNGKCFHQIVAPTDVEVTKFVQPASQCTDPSDPTSCVYINQIQTIELIGYTFAPPTVPDVDHELLFEIDEVQGIFAGCQPYVSFSNIPGGGAIPWGGTGVGGPANPLIGYGQPSQFLTVNHIVQGSPTTNSYNDAVAPWAQGTNLAQLYGAILLGLSGTPYFFTYSAGVVGGPDGIGWYPDFPGCDAAADPNFPGAQYGIVTVDVVFQIFQAAP